MCLFEQVSTLHLHLEHQLLPWASDLHVYQTSLGGFRKRIISLLYPEQSACIVYSKPRPPPRIPISYITLIQLFRSKCKSLLRFLSFIYSVSQFLLSLFSKPGILNLTTPYSLYCRHLHPGGHHLISWTAHYLITNLFVSTLAWTHVFSAVRKTFLKSWAGDVKMLQGPPIMLRIESSVLTMVCEA